LGNYGQHVIQPSKNFHADPQGSIMSSNLLDRMNLTWCHKATVGAISPHQIKFVTVCDAQKIF